jgi:MFS family permease
MPIKENPQFTEDSPRFYYGYIVVIAAFFIMIAMYGTRYSFGVFFKPMVSDFGWSRALTSGAFSISTIVQGLLSIIMGGLNDKYGPRIVLTTCGFLVGLGYLLMSQINATWQLYLFYTVIIGSGMSGGFVPVLSTVARWFTKRRSMMTGITLAGVGLGNFIMPPVTNWLISTYGWRNSFMIWGCVVLACVILAAQFLKLNPTKMKQTTQGSISKEGKQANSGDEGFTLREAVRTRQLWMGFILFFCLGFCIMAITVHIVPHATDLGISSAIAANILASLGLAGLMGGISLGNVADRIGNRQTYIICFVLMLSSFLWLLPDARIWTLFLFVVLFNFGAGGGGTLESPLAAELFGLKSHGVIFGVMGSGFTLGSACGPVSAGYIFDVTGDYHLAFMACVAVLIAGLILAMIIRPVKQ